MRVIRSSEPRNATRLSLQTPIGPLTNWLAWVTFLAVVSLPTAHANDAMIGKCGKDLTKYRSFQPFSKDGTTYMLAQMEQSDAEADLVVNSHSVSWWKIRDNPANGYECVTRAKLSSKHMGVRTFTIGGEPYLYGLHASRRAYNAAPAHDRWLDQGSSYVGPVVWRFDEAPTSDFAVRMYKNWPYKLTYRDMLFFTLNGQTYALSRWDKGANIWQVQDDPKTGVSFNLHLYAAKMSQSHILHGVLYANDAPYIIGSHKNVQTTIWRVESSPPGSKAPLALVHLSSGNPSLRGFDYVLPFHIQDPKRGKIPYLLAVELNDPLGFTADLLGALGFDVAEDIVNMLEWIVQLGKGRGVIYALEGTPLSPTLRRVSKVFPMSHRYKDITVFEQAGKAYIFGIHEEGHANMWEIAVDGTGFNVIYDGLRGGPPKPTRRVEVRSTATR